MQSDRPISITSPLGDDVLLFYAMNATEALGRMFDFEVGVLSEDHAVKLEDLLGQPITVTLDLAGDGKRHFHGLVSQLSYVGTVGRYAHYGLRLRPWLWFLTRTTDCRIFQGMTVPDIIKEVFGDLGFSDVEDSLTGSYAPWDYCVQYRESAFNFVSRLMEQEGIYYYFKHEEDKHTLVLADSYSAHAPVSGYEEIPFYPPEESEDSDLDRFLDWKISQEVQATSYILNDYDFEAPKSDIKTSATATKKHSGTDYKVYDYPGEYIDTSVGDEYVKYRMEELTAGYETYSAQGTARGLMAGALFSLIDHPRADQNKEFLVVSAAHTLASGGYETGGGGGGLTYEGSIVSIDAQVPYRSQRITRKPHVQGPQTAVVVGPSGETVWTDKYGRIKAQFHWDRHGSSDENSSCWMRVSQAWAGKNWGGMHIPHVGQEVVVDFLEGDPDRPLVTGRVYNADNMPPLDLPGNKYKSIIQDHFGNKIQFDGTPGEEHVQIYSPSHGSLFQLGKSMRVFTKSDSKTYGYGNTHALYIGNKVSQLKGSSTSVIAGSYIGIKRGFSGSMTLGANLSVTVGQKASITIGGDLTGTLAWKGSFGLSREFKWIRGDYTRTSGEDMILDSKQDIIACGGEKDHSMLRSNDTEISLSWGKSEGDRNMSELDNGAKWVAAVAGLCTVGLASYAAIDSVMEANAANDAPSTERDGKEVIAYDDENIDKLVAQDILTTGSMVTSLVGVAGVEYLSKKQPSPKHDTTTAKVTVSNGKVVIFSGEKEKTTIRITENDGIEIETDKAIKVHSTGDIDLASDSGIYLSAPKAGVKKNKEFKFVGGDVLHPNLKLLK